MILATLAVAFAWVSHYRGIACGIAPEIYTPLAEAWGALGLPKWAPPASGVQPIQHGAEVAPARPLDDLVGALALLEMQRLGSLEVDHQLELDRRLNRKLARLGALEGHRSPRAETETGLVG